MSAPNDPVHTRLEELLAAYGSRVRALLVGYGLDKHGIDPADVEQEVRIRLWHALERDRSGAFHASYVQRVVASTVIDALRRAQVRAAEPLPEEDDGTFDVELAPVAPERRAGDLQHMQGLQRCLAEIPERRRLPIALHLQGFSLQEIADIAGIPSAEAARKLVSRGLEGLKQRLRELGLGDFED
ncbi:MAG: RNA polymerase sigma factor [Dokdonella sp.]|uniref:RNA polymerase sigma factor n=1 Tax=Dokdonella sp. TaxID=2291710 RepID=UPI0025BE4A88|nr:RNA polymerase sigma factor [Dokdonella sp.]MBX3700973.1 RNA polymerase sigma factor [Dokdonella sp.]MCW5577528.1 RNA polymerase sigma factor [Dokdonella sp.]